MVRKEEAVTEVQDLGSPKENPKEEESPQKEVTKEVVKETEAKEREPSTSTWSRLRRCPRSKRKPRWHNLP